MTDRQITLHLEAESAEQLSMLTIQAQFHWGLSLSFFDFSQTKNGRWVCWFTVPHSLWLERVKNG